MEPGFPLHQEKVQKMKIISIFNNKGGVGKTTLSFHLGHALASMNKKVLLIDLDPQCNLTVYGMKVEDLHNIWEQEDQFIDEFEDSKKKLHTRSFNKLIRAPRSIHFLLKPTEEGTAELPELPPPYPLGQNIDLIPGRLTMYMYEDTIARRWSDVYRGDPLAIKTVTRIKEIAYQYGDDNRYDYIILDTSPSLGAMNKVAISIVDGFVVPCMPDMFSLYGIRNIGKSLSAWKKEFNIIFHLLSTEKVAKFQDEHVQFLGYTIYNAKKYSTDKNPWDLAIAAYNYAKKIPDAVFSYITEDVRKHFDEETLRSPIGGTSIMHTHSTLPSMAQKYNLPMWQVPDTRLDPDDKGTVTGNRKIYYETQAQYTEFAKDLLKRLKMLGR